jgi:class 3 adenylate cyclase
MRAALDRHDSILHRAIEEHRGHAFKTVGDAFCAVIATASDALGYRHTPAQRAFREPYLVATRSLSDGTAWQATYAKGWSAAIGKTISRALEEAANGSEGQARSALG